MADEGMEEMTQGQQGAADPQAQIKEALEGVMASTDAMKAVAEAFAQMGQKGPAAKLSQAADLASSAIQEMMGQGGASKPAAKPTMGIQDTNAAGSNAQPIP